MRSVSRDEGLVVRATTSPASLAARLAAAAGVWLLAFGLTFALRAYLARANFAVFWIAVLFAAWYAGFGAALVAAILAVVAVEYVVVASHGAVGTLTPATAATLAIFVAASALVSALAAARARAQRAAAAYAQQLEEQATELESQMEAAQALAEQLAQANDRLEAAAADARRAGAEATAAAARARRLLSVAAGLGEAVTAEEVADVVLHQGLSAIGADAGSLVFVRHADGPSSDGLEGATAEIVRAIGYAEPVVAAYRRFPVRAGGPVSDAILSGQAVLLSSRDEWYARYPGAPFDHREAGFEAFVSIPVASAGRVLATINASFRSPLAFDDATRTFLASLGEQCALALARAEAFDAELRARRFVADTLASVRDGFIAFDSAFRYRYVNARIETLVGRPASELLGRELWEVFPAAARTKFGAALRRVRETRTYEAIEEFARGSRRWLAMRIYPSDDGGITVFVHDVTDERRARDASEFLVEASRLLSASLDYEATLRAVAAAAVPALGDWCAVDIVRDPMSTAWPPVVDRLAVVHADPAKVSIATELARRYPSDWSAPLGVGAAMRERRPLLLREITEETLAAIARDAEHLAALRALQLSSAIVVPLVARDVTLGAITVATSESARRYDERDLALLQDVATRAATAIDNARLFRDAERARAEAEAANRAKSQFLSAMSHELRTPLNAITGYTELLEMGIRGPVTGQQREDLVRVRRSANVLMSLVNDVLNFARVEAGRVEIRGESVRVDHVLADLEALVAPQVRRKHLAYRYDGCGDDAWVLADADRLKQILTNVLANAIKFTPDGGRIRVACDAGPDVVRVRVHDTGRGIPADKLEAIFEPFVQLDRHLTHSSQQGVGLGLAISRDLARAMGGDLTVESEVGVGSTFVVTLPRSELAADVPPPERRDEPA